MVQYSIGHGHDVISREWRQTFVYDVAQKATIL